MHLTRSPPTLPVMDARQETQQNPYGMDENCTNCARADERARVVHGYGDASADFVFVGHTPSEAAETAGVPFVGDEAGERFQDILGNLGLNNSLPTSTSPELDNAYLCYLARCRHPDHAPTDDELRACEPYLTADIRMINPEIIVPVGERALDEIAREYTTTPAGELSVDDHHATSVRGRGFELVPMKHPGRMTDHDKEQFITSFLDLMQTDYRQTKGRRGR